MKIKTIDVEAKKWFDKINGNTYFSAKVTINYGYKTEKTILVPYQYGYGNYYEHASFLELQKQKLIDKNYNDSLYRYCQDNNIIFRSRIEKDTKRNCKAFVNE